MKIIKEKVHPFLALVNYCPERKIKLNKKEICILEQAKEILEKGSKLNESLHLNIEPHEDQFFVASVEVDYILREIF